MARRGCERFDFRPACRAAQLTAQVTALCLLAALLASACAPTRSLTTDGAQTSPGSAGSVAASAATCTTATPGQAGATPNGAAGPADGGPPTGANPTLVADCAGLHIEGGFSCGPGSWVLASSRLTYDTGEIQQIESFFNSPNLSSALPATLHEVSMPTPSVPCSVSLTVTNTSSHVIEVARMGVQLLASSRPNTYTYRLVDICSILTPNSSSWSQYCPAPGYGSQPHCNTFFEQIALKNGVTGDVFDAVPQPEVSSWPTGGTPVACPPTMTLNPTDTDIVGANFSGAAIYPIALHLSLLTASGPQTVTLAQFPSTLIFVGASNLQCYKLDGQTFSLELSGEAVFSNPQTPPYQDCV